MKARGRATIMCEELEEILEEEEEAEQGEEEERVEQGPSMADPPRAKRSKREARPAVARRALDSQPVTEIRYGDLDALPVDVWRRIANAVATREGCTCSWPLVPSAIAMPSIRRALPIDEPLMFYEDCECAPSAISLAQRFRSFAWLTKQHPNPSKFIFSLIEAPPPVRSSLMRSCLFSSLSTITSLDLYFSQGLPSHPRLLFSLSQAPRLEWLLIAHGVASDRERAIPPRHCNDAVMVEEMWDLITLMEEEEKANDKVRPFPALRYLSLDLPACSPLVLRFISCLSAQLHSLSLGGSNQFAVHEGREGAESGENAEGRRGRERDADGRKSFSLHFPLATNVRFHGINCSISLSAPRLTTLGFLWKSHHSRLHLLPTCPAHLPSLFLRADRPCQWPLHAPHLTSLESLCTNMQPEQAACLPPGVLATVKALEWREIRVLRPLDLRAWHSLRCFHAMAWGPVSLSALRSGVLWPCGVEGLFFDSIGSDVVELFKSDLRGDDGGESLGRRHAEEGTPRRREGIGMEIGGCLRSAVEGRPVEDGRRDMVHINGGNLLARLLPKCKGLQRFEGWDYGERVLYRLDAAEGLSTEVGGNVGESWTNKRRFLKERGIVD